MPVFDCKLGTKSGNVIFRKIEARYKDSLISSLKGEGYFVLRIIESGEESLQKSLFRCRKRVTNKELQNFNKELLVLLRAGLPLVKSITIIQEKIQNHYFKEILQSVIHDIETGVSTSEAFGKYDFLFSNLYVSSLYAGEKSGKVAEVIEDHIDYLEKTEEMRQKIVSASLYPIILIIFILFTVIFLLSYVVPTFTDIYIKSNTSLPQATMVLLAVSDLVKNNIAYIMLGSIGLIFGFNRFNKTENGKLAIDRLRLSLPHIGDIFLYYSLTKVTRTLSILLKSGIHIVESLHTALPLLGNGFLEENFKQVVRDVEEGELFSKSLEKTGVFPAIVIQMVTAGETTGALTVILPEITSYYENELKSRIGLLTTLIEPVLMILVGLVIAFILISMYLPIFQMAGTV